MPQVRQLAALPPSEKLGAKPLLLQAIISLRSKTHRMYRPEDWCGYRSPAFFPEPCRLVSDKSSSEQFPVVSSEPYRVCGLCDRCEKRVFEGSNRRLVRSLLSYQRSRRNPVGHAAAQRWAVALLVIDTMPPRGLGESTFRFIKLAGAHDVQLPWRQ